MDFLLVFPYHKDEGVPRAMFYTIKRNVYVILFWVRNQESAKGIRSPESGFSSWEIVRQKEELKRQKID
jgi:hypothetical protein